MRDGGPFSICPVLGLSVERDPEATRITTPSDFERLFPGTGARSTGGRATAGTPASFERPKRAHEAAGAVPGGGRRASGEPACRWAALSGLDGRRI